MGEEKKDRQQQVDEEEEEECDDDDAYAICCVVALIDLFPCCLSVALCDESTAAAGRRLDPSLMPTLTDTAPVRE